MGGNLLHNRTLFIKVTFLRQSSGRGHEALVHTSYIFDLQLADDCGLQSD